MVVFQEPENSITSRPEMFIIIIASLPHYLFFSH
jgi:hypothetical protein